jgi:WD40 repeat protein
MLRRIIYATLAAILATGVTACDSSWASHKSGPGDTDDDTPGAEEPAPAAVEIGRPLYEPKNPPPVEPDSKEAGVAVDPVVIPCHLSVVDKEEVPALREGAIRFIGTNLKDGEQVPPELRVDVKIDGEIKHFRKLRVGDYVEKDQLMAVLDDRLARADKDIKDAKVGVAKAELAAAEKIKDEQFARYNTQTRLWNSQSGRVTSEEEVRGARVTWQKATYDAVSKAEALNQANLEAKSAQVVLELHEIRASISGIIRFLYKNSGESVKANDTVFRIDDQSRLRADGLIDRQKAPKLSDPAKIRKIVVEPSDPENPQQTLIGHFQDITGVAVSKDPKNPAVVSGSEDGTIRVWDRNTGREHKIWQNPGQSAVKAVACTPPASTANLCLSGSADGTGRLWDLDGSSDEPLRKLSENHQGPITCVAFSPDGETCATGGEDQHIRIWETATGKLRYRLPAGHHASSTWLQFTPQTQLVSVGRDKALRLWDLGETGAKQAAVFNQRSGEVVNLGVSPDGRTVLFDQGKSLRLLGLPNGTTKGVLFNPGASSNFTTFALFSPTGQLIVTAGAAEGQLQLWRTPSTATSNRGYEVRQLAFYQKSSVPTCACFSPDGKLLVTGTRDRLVQVWAMPGPKEIQQELVGELTLVEKSTESPTGQVRVWANVLNQGDRLLPGGAATLTVYPKRVEEVSKLGHE